MIHDFCIVGGGIVGLSTAMNILKQRPGASILLLEKEDKLAAHQTGHNSGVIHAGIYYAPGSLKASLCVKGLAATYEFCAQHAIRTERCGKLIVATNELEDSRIDVLYERARANGSDISRVSHGELREREPHITGTSALFSPQTGIVDYPAICRAMADVITKAGGEIVLDTEVTGISERIDLVEIETAGRTWQARKLVVCGGLQSDRLARLGGLEVDFRIIPFRGEYFQLPPEKNRIVSSLIYPAPDPSMPFLGIHLTRMIDGSVTVGPNAVLGMSREGYPKFSFSPRDLADSLSFSGFWRLLWRERGYVKDELVQSLSTAAYLNSCRKYCPELELADLLPYRAGIRAQAVMRNGTALHDFLFADTARSLHVLNAPSPAATSAIPIGEMIAEKALTNA